MTSPVRLTPATHYTIEQLTAAYNQTRVDYLVPMPMNAARLSEYIHHYDVDLSRSLVATVEGQVAGLGMLGVRPAQTWMTRLGVIPDGRRHGVGRAIVDGLLAASDALKPQAVMLEVIKNNTPAYNLFIHCGFKEVRELLVLRRPPAPPPQSATGSFRWLDKAEALALLAQRADTPTWITANASLAHAEHLMGMTGLLPDGSEGWVVFQEQRFRLFPMALARVTLHTQHGDPVALGTALLSAVYQQYPDLDTQTENIAATDPHLPAFFAMGYVESFRRLEMRRPGPLMV